MHRWMLDQMTNRCVKHKIGMKFKLSLASIMVIAIIVGLLYLVLDDKYFCLKKSDSNDLGSSGRPPRGSSNGNAVTSDKDKTDEEQENLFKQKI